MKRLKHNFKKGMAFVLSLAMIAGLVPAMPGGADKVRAASGSGSDNTPSVSAFATKTQLMNEFTPNSDGTAANIGKLVFGKNSSGSAQHWYILGKDDGVSGDNTILFAASPIAIGKQFNSSLSNKTYSYNAGTGYGNSDGSTEVYANHYGASDLRGALQGMLKETNGNTVTSYFTKAEQGMMNDTTVTTNDTKNNVSYTTTDKLYALAADGYGSSYKTIKAGSDNRTVLAMISYWSSGSWFWLRSPYDIYGSDALLAIPGDYVSIDYVDYVHAVQPASNLNLSSVIFASAAKAASSESASSGTITTYHSVMTLRLDGSDQTMGNVIYDNETGRIAAQKAADSSETVSLVVQGNDGTKDWYYSVRAGGKTVVTKEQIRKACGISRDIDFAKCKIWLETTDDGVAYAKMIETGGSSSPPDERR